MPFITKINLQDNRQHYLPNREQHDLSGVTVFGVPYSALTSGPNPNNSGTTSSIINIISSFSGNSGTTIFTFGDSRMGIAQNYLEPITSFNSATTQNTGYVWVGNQSQNIDGNLSYLDYTGTSFNFEVTAITETSPGIFVGSGISDDVFFLSADTLDYTGRTIWSDVRGILRTDKIIVTDGAALGYVLTSDNEGRGIWMPNTSADTNTFTTGTTLDNEIAYFNTNVMLSAYTLDLTSISHWSASTGLNAIVNKNSGSIANGDYSIAIGGNNNILTSAATNSVIIGGENLTGISSNTLYTPNTVVNGNLGIGIEPNYLFHVFNGDSHLIYDASLANDIANFVLSADTNDLSQIAVAENGGDATSISIGIRGGNEPTYVGYGKQNDAFIYCGFRTNGLNIQTAANGAYPTKENYIRFYAGQTANGTIPDLNIQGGTGSTRGYVGVNVTSPTEVIDVGGNGRFRSIGSSASAGALHYTANGVLTTNTSDIRFKTEITSIDNALDKISKLRGVYYKWKEDVDEGINNKRLGFIAQEVNEIVPELSFINKNVPDNIMGVHYQDVTALLVEGMKELISGNTTNNSILQTQTIVAEDNIIELNFGGNHKTAKDGGIIIKHGMNENEDSFIQIDDKGKWVIGPSLTTYQLTLPEYSPKSSKDNIGSVGDVVWDDDFLFIKTNNGWKRTILETF